MRNRMLRRKANAVVRTGKSGYWLRAMTGDTHIRGWDPNRACPMVRG